MLNQCRLAERRDLLKGPALNDVQVFALEIVMFDEWLKERGRVPQFAAPQSPGPQYIDDDIVEGAEDLSEVQWESPSKNPEVFQEIEAFNRAMADSHMTVAADEGGEWL